jgi:uncharacterized membrane protein YjjB (DUF3815 family)
MKESLLIFALKDAGWTISAASIFSCCLGVPARYALLCGICAAVGHTLQAVLLLMGTPLAAATFFGAMLIGFVGIIFGKIWHLPRVALTVPALLPMLPGTFVFNGLLAVVNTASMSGLAPSGVALDAFSNFMRAGIILCALTAGIALPNLMIGYHKPQV